MTQEQMEITNKKDVGVSYLTLIVVHCTEMESREVGESLLIINFVCPFYQFIYEQANAAVIFT